MSSSEGIFFNDFSFLLVLNMVIKTQHSDYLYRFLASLVLGFVRLLLLISLIWVSNKYLRCCFVINWRNKEERQNIGES